MARTVIRTGTPLTELYLMELDELLRSGSWRSVYPRAEVAAEIRRRTGLTGR